MNEAQLKSIIENIRHGINVESDHLDIKKKWYDLENDISKSEFLKDIVALANAPFGGERNIIIGVDEKTGDVNESILPADEANLQQILLNNIYPNVTVRFLLFEIESSHLTVINILNSDNRPHVMKYHYRVPKQNGLERLVKISNYIPIRRGSSTDSVNRTDLDEMYFERSALKSSDLKLKVLNRTINLGSDKKHISPWIPVQIINQGTIAVSVVDVYMVINGQKISSINSVKCAYPQSANQGLLNYPLRIEGNGAIHLQISYNVPRGEFERLSKNECLTLIVKDATGKEVSTDIEFEKIGYGQDGNPIFIMKDYIDLME